MDDRVPSTYLADALGSALPQLIGALYRAYQDACDARATFAGANEVTFGTDVYQFAKHYVGVVDERTALLEILEDEEPKFRFKIGKYVLACHKVGRRLADDIRSSFPRARGASTMVESQLALPGILLDLDDRTLRKASKVVVAHMGNHDEGLCAVYLCIAAGGAEDETIRGWSHVECVWRRDQPGALEEANRMVPPSAPDTDTGAAAPLPEPEAEVDAEPRRRIARKRHGGPSD